MQRCGFLDSKMELKLFIRGIERTGTLESIAKSDATRAFYTWGDHDGLPVKVPG